MNKLFFLLFTSIMILGCESKEKKSNNAIEYKSIDYINSLTFSLSSDEVLQLLPENKKMVTNSEDGFLYEFENEGINHQITALFYGEKYFNTLIATLIFSKENSNQILVFDYLKKMLANKKGKAFSHDKTELEETLTWIEQARDQSLNYEIRLSNFENTISVSFLTSRSNEEDFEENHANGEWVQSGENGDWTFVPN